MNKIKKVIKAYEASGVRGLKPHGQARGPRGRAGEESAGELAAGDQRLGLGFMDVLIEGSLEVKLPTIWTVEKQR
jgi:hypothetical protein